MQFIYDLGFAAWYSCAHEHKNCFIRAALVCSGARAGMACALAGQRMQAKADRHGNFMHDVGGRCARAHECRLVVD